MKRFIWIWALSACVGSFAPSHAAATATEVRVVRPQAPIAPRHMIVAAEPDAAEAGREMLRAGGSAADAAIAAQLVLTLVEPQSSGIGGGLYIVVSDSQALRGYDGRETAPASAHPGMFLDARGNPRGFRDIQYGGLAVGVPGTVAALAMAHRAHGRLPWARLFAPAIRLAERGYEVQPRMALEERDIPRLVTMPDMRALLFHADGSRVRPGEVLRNTSYADTLRRIAAEGPEGFYRGPVADRIVTAVSAAPVNPARLTHADLASYRAIEREPLCGFYRAYRVCSMPPSTSGGVTVLQILGLVERFSSEQLTPGTVSSVHLISEASRLAYADRAHWLADPDFVRSPVEGLLDRDYLRLRSQSIDISWAMRVGWPGTPPMRAQLRFAPMPERVSSGTTHLSVVDERGQVVSLTGSIQAAYGAGLMAGGFVLNNELTDFSFRPVVNGLPVANAPAAGKRPLSSMSPVIVFGPDGRFFASLGSPGGRAIIAYVAQAVIGLIDGRLSMPEVAAQPRHVNQNGSTQLEAGTPLESLRPALQAMGHQAQLDTFESGVNGIRRVASGYEGGADPRREGIALGD